MSKNFELMQQIELNPATIFSAESAAPSTQSGHWFARRRNRTIAKSHIGTEELLDKLTREETARLVQSVFLQNIADSPKCILFAGIDHGNGCSQICAQAATILASNIAGSVCLVEANLRSPSLPEFFGTANHHGLTDALLKMDAIKNYAKRTNQENLWLLSSGSTAAKTQGMLNSENMKSRINELRNEFNYLIIDSPPLNQYSDALALGELADGMILVIEAGSTRREAALKVAENLRTTKIKIVGAVLNKRTFPIPESLYRLL